MIPTSLHEVIAIGAVVIMLDVYDSASVSGRRMGIAGALVAAAIHVIGVWPSVLVGLIGVIVSQVPAVLRGQTRSASHELSIRLVALLAALGIDSLFTGAFGWGRTIDVVVVPSVFLVSAAMAARVSDLVITGGSIERGMTGILHRHALLLVAQTCAAVLTVILFDAIWIWSLLPVVTLLLFIRQSYAMLVDVRDAYRATVGVLAETAECSDSTMLGHAERVATITRAIGARCGMGDEALEMLTFAAYLHDVRGIADEAQGSRARSSSAHVVREVGFLSEVVPILRIVEGRPPSNATDKELLGGFIVALSSDLDSAANGDEEGVHLCSHRVARRLPPRLKARAVSAALSLGYSVPAVE